MVVEILEAPDWEHVETQILGRYEDDLIAWAVRFLGGGRPPAGSPREALVELLRQQYRRHSDRQPSPVEVPGRCAADWAC